jgi:hypothetical protein
MIPLAVPEIRPLLAAAFQRPHPPGHATHWMNWRRRHQARSCWVHQRTRLNRDNALVNQQMAAAVSDDYSKGSVIVIVGDQQALDGLAESVVVPMAAVRARTQVT